VGAGVQPETGYAWLGRDRIACQVLGQGPPDLVATPGSFTHVDLVWEDPAAAVFYRRLASFSRLIRFDRLGTGASDPVPLERLPPWESYAEELAAVLDEVGSDSAVILVGWTPARWGCTSPRPARSAPGR
jgi:pimeloyl-ACP methyl ester carboxylesterase